MWHVIINPLAGDRTAEQFVKTHVLPLLDSHNQPYTTHTTAAPKDAGAIGTRIAAEPSPHRVILAGGDGTAHELIEGIDASNGRWELVIIPLGTANALYYSFFRDDKTKLASLNLALGGTAPRRLPVTYTQWGDSKPIPSTIVTSTALHAAILKDSEALRHTHGIERFKIAAAQNITTFFDATVRFDYGRQWNPRTKEFAACPQEMEGPFAYLVSCTSVDRLEPAFVIAPTRRVGSEDELAVSMDVVILRPLRDPRVRDASEGDKGQVWAQRAAEVLGAAYQEGRHVELEYEDGSPVVEVVRCRGFEWVPGRGGGEGCRTVCADGSIYEIPEGESARVEVRGGGEEGFWAYV